MEAQSKEGDTSRLWLDVKLTSHGTVLRGAGLQASAKHLTEKTRRIGRLTSLKYRPLYEERIEENQLSYQQMWVVFREAAFVEVVSCA